MVYGTAQQGGFSVTQHEKMDLILENQKQLMKEVGFIEELLKALLINDTLSSVEKFAQSENNNNSQNDEFKNSSEKYHKSQIGKQVKISNNCNHYFDGRSHYMELSLFANHRNRTWTIKDYRMGKYKLYWTNGSHTFELWFDTNDVVY